MKGMHVIRQNTRDRQTVLPLCEIDWGASDWSASQDDSRAEAITRIDLTELHMFSSWWAKWCEMDAPKLSKHWSGLFPHQVLFPALFWPAGHSPDGAVL